MPRSGREQSSALPADLQQISLFRQIPGAAVIPDVLTARSGIPAITVPMNIAHSITTDTPLLPADLLAPVLIHTDRDPAAGLTILMIRSGPQPKTIPADTDREVMVQGIPTGTDMVDTADRAAERE